MLKALFGILFGGAMFTTGLLTMAKSADKIEEELLKKQIKTE